MHSVSDRIVYGLHLYMHYQMKLFLCFYGTGKRHTWTEREHGTRNKNDENNEYSGCNDLTTRTELQDVNKKKLQNEYQPILLRLGT
jgi:hypothetical protein